MGFKLLNLCLAALSLCPLKTGSVRAQCTQPSFASRNVILTAEHLSTQRFPDGSTVTFECVIGHRPADLKASKSVTCQGNQWTNLELSCTRKSCGSLADFPHGRYEMTGNLFGDTAKQFCDEGYMLAGQETTRTCRDQGWDGRDPLCEPVTCSAPPAIENGQLEDEHLESYDYLQAVSYRCNKGFNPIGQSTLHCSEDGTFKPDPPKCFAAKCQAPPIIENGQIEAVFYKCNSGFFLNGHSSLYCSEDGTFKQDLPKCLEGSVCDGICLGKQRHDNNPV